MPRIHVRQGTDTRHPSVRVRILDQPPDAEGCTVREIALVFRSNETRQTINNAIHAAVYRYITEHHDPAPPLADALLGERSVPDTPPRESLGDNL